MFLKHNDQAVYPDLSTELRDADDWIVGILRNLDYYLDICTIAIEPLAGLLAIGIIFGIFILIQLSNPFPGTSQGIVHIFGGPGVESKLLLPEPVRTRFLQFALSLYKLVCVGT
jgi:syntaxin-binding protein 5